MLNGRFGIGVFRDVKLVHNPLFDDSELLKSFLQVIGIVPFSKELSAK